MPCREPSRSLSSTPSRRDSVREAIVLYAVPEAIGSSVNAEQVVLDMKEQQVVLGGIVNIVELARDALKGVYDVSAVAKMEL
ncbi:hypothetical protein AC579_4234 [Pseudocercospora musae]|uniref:Uncharacterized protein n=1 Tax=Pseudocercospora musae TaxID=113226 RepID=A0A139IDE1_9PEZI|nr:hypothetical protein AC579_4234 [Pseudocercospora musae]